MATTSIDSIIEKHLKQIKNEVIAFLTGTGDASAPTVVPVKRGRAAGKVAKKTARKAAAVTADGEQAPARAARGPRQDLTMETNDLMGVIRAYGPEGAKADELIEKSKMSKATVTKVIKNALKTGRLTKTGSTRSTRYFPAAEAAAE